MSAYTEAEMRIPILLALAAAKSGFMSTSDLIDAMMEHFKPDFYDLEILNNRSDTHFSQKVRNTVSHKSSSASLIKKGLINYRKELAGLEITEAGRAFLTTKGL